MRITGSALSRLVRGAFTGAGALSVVLAAGCAGSGAAGLPGAPGHGVTQSPARAAFAPAAPPAAPVIRPTVSPSSVTFISATDGWLLGGLVSGDSSRIVPRRTTDGGRHWSATPVGSDHWRQLPGTTVHGDAQVVPAGATGDALTRSAACGCTTRPAPSARPPAG